MMHANAVEEKPGCLAGELPIDQVAARSGAFAAMPTISLIVLDRNGQSTPRLQVDGWVDALSGTGHSIELVRVGADDSSYAADDCSWVASTGAGLSRDAFHGMRHSSGDILIVVDGSRAFPSADIAKIAGPLLDGAARVAVGDCKTRGWRKLVLGALYPLTGSWATFSSLIAITREAFQAIEREAKPVGTRFSLEILSRVREGRTDVEVRGDGISGSSTLTFDDLRHAKWLADDKLGNLSRLIQFCVVGASGMVVDLTLYVVFQWIFGRTGLTRQPTFIGPTLDLVAARVLAVCVALIWNFTLNRRLTFNYAKKSAILPQFVTYVLSNALGIALSLTLSLTLPEISGFFSRHKLAAAVVGIVSATGVSFSMSRWLVFRHRAPAPELSPTPETPEVSVPSA